jgi:hypothetical protein
MAEWERVEMSGDPDVQSDPDHPSLVVVSIPLSPQPDKEWVEIFNSGPPPGMTLYASREFPKASPRAVHFRCDPAEVGTYRDQAARRVEGTNAYYESYVLRETDRQEAAKRAEAEERQRAIDEARRKLQSS